MSQKKDWAGRLEFCSSTEVTKQMSNVPLNLNVSQDGSDSLTATFWTKKMERFFSVNQDCSPHTFGIPENVFSDGPKFHMWEFNEIHIVKVYIFQSALQIQSAGVFFPRTWIRGRAKTTPKDPKAQLAQLSAYGEMAYQPRPPGGGWSSNPPIVVDWLVVSTHLKNMKVSWDDYSQYMEKYGKIKNVPNHQPVEMSVCWVIGKSKWIKITGKHW